MSYDVRVWGRRAADLGSRLPGTRGWKTDAGGWVLRTRSWQIVVGAPGGIEHDDIPPEIAEILPGLSTLVELRLEPISAPKSARALLSSTARAIAEALAGIVEDPQESSLSLPRGAKRYAAPKRDERFTVLALSWWYMDSPLRSLRGVADFVTILHKNVKEALPRRYGLWEPPPFKAEETGLDAFVDFLHQNLDEGVVCYTSRPVVGVHISDCAAAPHPRLGFRSNHVTIEFEASALEQPGWELAIRNLWRAVSLFLRPFYGDVRLLAEHIVRDGTVASDIRTESHPVRSWFWRGIPAEPGLALVLGPPYADLWLPASAVHVEDLLFAETPSWAARRPLDLSVPDSLAQRRRPGWVETPKGGDSEDWCDEMPATWPLPRP